MVDTQKYDSLLEKNYVKELGRVTRVVGLTIESQGPDVVLEDMCVVTSKDHSVTALCEVIGFKDDYVILMPYEDISGIGVGSTVMNTGAKFSVKVGQKLLGMFNFSDQWLKTEIENTDWKDLTYKDSVYIKGQYPETEYWIEPYGFRWLLKGETE